MGSSWIGIVFALTAVAASVVVAQAAPLSQPPASPPAVSASATPAPSPNSQTGSGQTGNGQTGNGQMGGGQMGNTTPTPNPTGQAGGGSMGTPTPKSTPTPQAGSGNSERISVPLQTMPAGTVTLSVDTRSRLVMAQLNLFGLAPGTQHRVALYRDRDGGRPLATFPNVTVDGSGQLIQTVTSTSRVHGSLPRSLFFQIDLQPSGQPRQQIAVAHSPVSRTGSNHVTLAFASTIARPGHATLSYDPGAHSLTVSLQVSGLVPGSHHAAHIHSGSCQVQGAVLYPLPDLVANADGSATEQVTIPVQSAPPASGWYVNVHDGNMNDILQADGQPGPLFQPLVCGNVQGQTAPQPFSGTHS